MSRQFSDHFSSVASNYAHFRPTYPEELFAWLAKISPGHDLVWDCAAGSGQASVDLANYFERVLATDASQAQIGSALPHPKIEYRVAPAEASGLAAASVDLITVAQALHWFDLDRFYEEAKRVLKPRGVLAAWTYGVQTLEDANINALVQNFYHETLGRYWPPERRHVESGYLTLAFPFTEIPAPPLVMQAHWKLPQLLGYFGSWSATARYVAERGADPVAALATRLTPLWGDPDGTRLVTWPLALRVGTIA